MRVMIADDEPLARAQIHRLCESHPDLEIVAQAGSGAAAVEAIRAHRPDVVILDIELQDMTGFDVLESVSDTREPFAIILTAYPQHALRAFDAAAIDYLTKPVDISRFGMAIDRARYRHSKVLVSRMWEKVAADVCASLSMHGQGASAMPRHIVGERAHRHYFICIEEVDLITSNGNYVTIHSGDDRYVSRNTLKHLGEVLAPAHFLRIDRSMLLNLSSVAFAERTERGVFAFTLRRGQRVVSSATYRRRISEAVRNGRLTNVRNSH